MNFSSFKLRIKNSLSVLLGKKNIAVVNSDVVIKFKLTAKEVGALKLYVSNKPLDTSIALYILQRVLLQCTSTYYESEYEIFKVSIDKPETFDIKISPDGTVKVD